MRIFRIFHLFVTSCFFLFSGCIIQHIDAQSLEDIALAQGATTFLTALELSNLIGFLDFNCPRLSAGQGLCFRLTAFVPTNDAFDKLGSLLDDIINNVEEMSFHLRSILFYHITLGENLAENLLGLPEPIPPITGQLETLYFPDRLSFDLVDEGTPDQTVLINDGTRVLEADLVGTNGVVHMIDSVLLPEFMTRTIYGTVVNKYDFLLEALNRASPQIRAALQGIGEDGPWTLFAPNDRAFDKIMGHPARQVLILSNQTLLNEILSYHVVPGRILYQHMLGRAEAIPTLLEGETHDFTQKWVPTGRPFDYRKAIFIDDSGAAIVDRDILTQNGIIHEIDEVLLPEGLVLPEVNLFQIVSSVLNLSILGKAIFLLELEDALRDDSNQFTIFAPSDDAFLDSTIFDDEGQFVNIINSNNSPQELSGAEREYIESIVSFHVINGEAVDLAGLVDRFYPTLAPATGMDIVKDGPEALVINNAVRLNPPSDWLATNGVVHLMDDVVLQAPPNIPATASSVSIFSTLVSLLSAASLVDALSTAGPYTVFAPTNQAFLDLDERFPGVLDVLTNEDNVGLLTDVLLFHVSSAHYPLAKLENLDGFNIQTLLADNTIEIDAVYDNSGIGGQQKLQGILLEGGFQVNLDASNVFCSNGVIHVMDNVLVNDNLLSEIAPLLP